MRSRALRALPFRGSSSGLTHCCLVARRTQTLPGKVEFDYLPENCQAVLMLPVLDASAVVVIGTNRARAFTPKDIAWMKGLCDQAALSLRQAAVA